MPELYESRKDRQEDSQRHSEATMLTVSATETDPATIAAGVNAIQEFLEAKGEVTLTT